MATTFGVLSLVGGGTPYDVTDGTTYSVQTVETTAFRTQNGRTHYRETPVTPFIAATIVLADGQTAAELDTFRGDVQLALRTGKTIILRDARTVGVREPSADDGTVDVRWEGQSGEEF